MRARLIAAAAALTVLAGSAGAQDPQPDPLYKLDPRSRVTIESIIDSAKQAGLPWNSVRLKAYQGINSHQDASRIVTVVRTWYASLAKAKEVLGPHAPATDIESGASALMAGLKVEDLSRFRILTPDRSAASALVYLSDLVSKQGVPRAEAVEAFEKLWKEGAADADFLGLWQNIGQDILSGVSPGKALQNRVRSLPTRPIKPPAEEDKENPYS